MNTTRSHRDRSDRDEGDPKLRALIARIAAPTDLGELNGPEIEAILDAESTLPFSEEQIATILGRSLRLSAEFRSQRSRSGEPPRGYPAVNTEEGNSTPSSLPGTLGVAPCRVPSGWLSAPLGSPSPILGFLGNISPIGSSFTPTLWALLVLISGMAFTLTLVIVVAVRGVQVHVVPDLAANHPEGTRNEASKPVAAPASLLPASSSQRPSPELAAAKPPANCQPFAARVGVAAVTKLADCRWVDSASAPKSGDRLRAGQSLQLAGGVVCLEFDVGAKLIVQGPARLTIVSGKQIRLDRGKLAAEIKSKKAHGFTVFTPQGTLVDLGTEFGVEIAPEGSSLVHVFRGKVEFALPTADGRPPLAAQCLLANGGARVEAGTDTLTLVADTGECFVRSLDRLEKDRHVVAYWRFEDQPWGALPPHTNKNITPVRATIDSSFNGNDLYAWADESRPKFSDKVATGEVPQTHSPNRTCLDNSDLAPQHPSGRNVYTRSAFSHASPIDIQKITPKEWTIEVSAKPAVLGDPEGAPRQTIVGRDTHNPPSYKFPAPARLSLEVTAQRRFAVNFYDVSGRPHEAVAEQLPVQINHWYHLAAVSDGRSLKLYVDEGNGGGYQLRAETPLPATGDTALGKGSDEADWTIGRGLVKGRAAASFQGCIDEVRVSDIARAPGEFLFAPAGSGDSSSAGPARASGAGK
jgi:hypothetical protein